MRTPLVSVVFPAYNAEKTIKEAIDSIISQTYPNWELLAIDDGSTDSTASIIQSYNDKRIKYFKNECNIGLINTLNRGITLCSGKYIARMDSDDISEPERFAKQVSYMEENSHVIVCGSNIRMFGKKEGLDYNVIARYENDDKALKNRLVSSPCFAHPAVMIRRDVIISAEIKYKEGYDYAEDYKLWIDLMQYGDYYNIDEVLLNYRLSDTQMTQKKTMVHPAIRQCRWDYLASVLDNDILCQIKETEISIQTIKKVRSFICNRYLLEVFYLSLNRYSAKTVIYFIKSKDYKILGVKFLLKMFNRALKNSPSKL